MVKVEFMKVCRNLFVSVCSSFPFIIASTYIGVFDISPALASHLECKKVFGKKVCITVPDSLTDFDPTKLIPGSKEAVEQLWGEAGSSGYPSAAYTMYQRNSSTVPLDEQQKEILGRRYGTLVNQVGIVYNAKMMDEMCALGKCTSTDSLAQTYCDRIYVRDAYKRGDSDQLMLLAHEMRHFEQCKQLGGVEQFGSKYFREFKRADQTYETNSMEEDARNTAMNFAKSVYCPEVGCDQLTTYFPNYNGWGIDLPVNFIEHTAARYRKDAEQEQALKLNQALTELSQSSDEKKQAWETYYRSCGYQYPSREKFTLSLWSHFNSTWQGGTMKGCPSG